MMLARGALISMVTVLFVLPGMFMIFDKLIVKTSIDFLGKKKEARKAAFAQRKNPQLQAAVQTAGAASADSSSGPQDFSNGTAGSGTSGSGQSADSGQPSDSGETSGSGVKG